jgi:hypothetical protein
MSDRIITLLLPTSAQKRPVFLVRSDLSSRLLAHLEHRGFQADTTTLSNAGELGTGLSAIEFSRCCAGGLPCTNPEVIRLRRFPTRLRGHPPPALFTRLLKAYLCERRGIASPGKYGYTANCRRIPMF